MKIRLRHDTSRIQRISQGVRSYYENAPEITKKCGWCDKEFTTKNPRQVQCSHNCNQLKKYHRRKVLRTKFNYAEVTRSKCKCPIDKRLQYGEVDGIETEVCELCGAVYRGSKCSYSSM